MGERRAEARQVNHAHELGPVEAARRCFHYEVKCSFRDLGRILGVTFDEGVQRLDHRTREDEAIAG